MFIATDKKKFYKITVTKDDYIVISHIAGQKKYTSEVIDTFKFNNNYILAFNQLDYFLEDYSQLNYLDPISQKIIGREKSAPISFLAIKEDILILETRGRLQSRLKSLQIEVLQNEQFD